MKQNRIVRLEMTESIGEGITRKSLSQYFAISKNILNRYNKKLKLSY